jgi:hypothetical protein
MSDEIRIWQIEEDALVPLNVTMESAGRTEPANLQSWIRCNPQLLGDDVIIIAEQVSTRSGPMDFLGVDIAGNTVVVTFKRDQLPRQALAQAIDYASDVASWGLDRLRLECRKFTNRELEVYLSEQREDIDWEQVSFNKAQRILLVVAGVDESLQRMSEWLSDNCAASINTVAFRYARTRSGDALLIRAAAVLEKAERQQDGDELIPPRTKTMLGKMQQQLDRGLTIPMSDEPGDYSDDELRGRLMQYLSEERDCPRRIRNIVLPLCLEREIVPRDKFLDRLLEEQEAHDRGQAGTVFSTVSREIGWPDRDYLRQVIRWRDVEGEDKKENFYIPDEYKQLVREVLERLDQQDGDELIPPRAKAMLGKMQQQLDRGLTIPMSDEPGDYSDDELRELLTAYLSEKRASPRRIRNIVLPLCLEREIVPRDKFLDRLLEEQEAHDRGQAGTVFSTVSREIGWPDRDYLRQVIRWRDVEGEDKKENFYIPDEYRQLVREILELLNQ